MRLDTKAKQKLLMDIKLGIVKQLYKDNLITDRQYWFLADKYSQRKNRAVKKAV